MYYEHLKQLLYKIYHFFVIISHITLSTIGLNLHTPYFEGWWKLGKVKFNFTKLTLPNINFRILLNCTVIETTIPAIQYRL